MTEEQNPYRANESQSATFANPRAAPTTGGEHAGFGSRLVAFLIDRVILLVVVAILSAAIALAIPNDEKVPLMFGIFAVFIGYFAWIPGMIYYVITEGSVHQASFGKRIMKLKVISADGCRPSLGQTIGRNLGGFVSTVIIVGYVMAAFTQRKQALHDMMASCLVVTESTPEGASPDGNTTASKSGVVALVLVAAGLFVVVVGGILAAIAIPAYDDYVSRAKIANAIVELKPAKTGYEAFYAANKQAPTLAEAGLANFKSTNIAAIEIDEEGTIIATLVGTTPVLKHIHLAPSPRDGADDKLNWACSSPDILTTKMPANCRD